jgi:hypothetical protein
MPFSRSATPVVSVTRCLRRRRHAVRAHIIAGQLRRLGTDVALVLLSALRARNLSGTLRRHGKSQLRKG